LKYYTKKEAKEEVSKGWSGLIDEVWKFKKRSDQIKDIKEKLGGLRISTYGSAKFQDFLEEIEDKSFTICEFCGKPGTPRKKYGWIKTTCDECHNNR